MKYSEAINRLRETKRDALANSCNIEIGRRELEVALKALEIVNDELPDMREKVKEYISELDIEIDRCRQEAVNHSASKIDYMRYMVRLETLVQVKSDLQGRLEELF